MTLWWHMVGSAAPKQQCDDRVKSCSRSSTRYKMGKCAWLDDGEAGQGDKHGDVLPAHARGGIVIDCFSESQPCFREDLTRQQPSAFLHHNAPGSAFAAR